MPHRARSQIRVTWRARRWLVIASAGALLVCAGVVLVPAAEVAGVGPAPLLRLAFRPACHQVADRCLDLGFGPLAVCARCSGLYAGGLLAILFVTIVGQSPRPPGRWLAAAALPTAADVAAGLLGLPGLANWPRFAVALPLGMLCGLWLARATVEAVRARASQEVD